MRVLIGAERLPSLSSSSQVAAESITLQIVAILVEDTTAGDAVGMVVASKL